MKKVLTSILAISLIALTISFNHNSNSNNVSALTYTDNVGLNFTFNPSITVSLSNASGGSSADLIINDLTPGTSSDSNIINVNVITNNANGYSLGANVGSSTLHNSNNAIYSTDRLIHSAYTSTDNVNATPPTKPIFTNLTSTVSALTDFNDNTWGYTYSLDNGTTWINAHEETEGTKDTGYNGLPLYSTTPAELTTKSSPSVSTGDTIQFKIGAKASTTQSSGEYNNVINFIAVGNTNPTSFYDAFSAAGKQMYNGYYKMQDMTTSICNSVYTSQLQDNTDTMEAQLIDIRDNNVYWVAKLKDGHCWMTQNLDLNLDSSVALTSNDTDLTDHSLTDAYQDGYTYDPTTGVTTWTPAESTIDASNNDFSGWRNTSTEPQSFDVGVWYEDGEYHAPETGCNYLDTSCAYFSREIYAINGAHGAIGNYYNWSASVASNNTAGLTSDTSSDPQNLNPRNSICPNDWRLPYVSITSSIASVGSTNEFGRVNYLYNNDSTSTDVNMMNAPLYFIRAGFVAAGRLAVASVSGYYWSSTVRDGSLSRDLYMGGTLLNYNSNNGRMHAWSVRCLAR